MRVYETLLFDNLEGFLSSCFPITRELLGVATWRRTARRFFAEQRCRSPLFRDIPGEFLAWMEGASTAFPDHPYLYEFMHYEWLELDVSICPTDIDMTGVESASDLIAGIPSLNPTARLACYRYPVHRIGPGFEADAADIQIYCYLVFRDAEDVVRFIELNPVSARLLELLNSEELTGYAAMRRIAEELNHPQPDVIVEMGRALLEELRRSGAVLGTRRPL